MTKAQMKSPFIAHMQGEENAIKVNDGYMARGMWNLIVSIRDVGMYAEIGIKPTSKWKISDVKKYFGVTGSADSIYQQLQELKSEVEQILSEQNK